MTGLVTVIVLSFNCTAETLACLDSLQQHDKHEKFDILVVDNASTDGAPDAIEMRYPDVPIVKLANNLGWAGGNNVGIRRALASGAELICLLNNDTVVPPGAITALANVANINAPCLMHPCIVYADPREGVQLDPSRGVPRRFAQIGLNGDVFELDFVYGACLMVPAALFRRIGLFDERFFLQLEETDFWIRARRVGYRSLCTTTAQIFHAESRSFGGRSTPMKTYYIVRNTLLLIEKHYHKPYDALRKLRALYWSICQFAELNDLNVIGILLAWLVSSNPFLVAARAGARDYVLRRFGPISASSLRAISLVR